MSSIETLRTQILEVIKNDDFVVHDLEKVLDPIGKYFVNPTFYTNITDVVAIITKDRNGDNQLTIEDLQLLGSDVSSIMALISAIMLLVGSLPSIKLQYNAGATEELIFKIMAYIFLVIVPKQIGKPMTFDQKQSVLNIALTIYQFAQSSQIVKEIVDKIITWFKTKGMCMCTAPATTPDMVVTKQLPAIKLNFIQAVNNVKDKGAMSRQINLLHQKIEQQSAVTKKKSVNKQKPAKMPVSEPTEIIESVKSPEPTESVQPEKI